MPVINGIATKTPNCKIRRRIAKSTSLFILEIIMIAFTAIYFYPLYAVVILSLKTTKEAIFTPLSFPKTLYLDNFVKAWNNMDLQVVLLNSIFVSTVSVVFIIIIASMASFTLAKRKNKLTSSLYIYFLAGMMIPLYTVLVPLVQLSKNLGLMNSEIGLCIIYMGTYMPFAVFLFVGFIKGIPNEIIEAATIDGCTVFKTFWVIVFPLLKPIVATMFILDFLGTWNQFLLPLLSLSDPSKQTVTLAMYAFFSGYGAQWQLAFAGYIIALSPLVVIYLFLQRYIVKGIMTGAVKG